MIRLGAIVYDWSKRKLQVTNQNLSEAASSATYEASTTGVFHVKLTR